MPVCHFNIFSGGDPDRTFDGRLARQAAVRRAAGMKGSYRECRVL